MMGPGDLKRSSRVILVPDKQALREARSTGRGPKIRRDSRQRAQRELLLWAIAEAVAWNGYETARVADVLELSGLSRSTFYKHFGDKEECFLAAYDAAIESLWERVEKALGGARPGDRAQLGLRALLEPLIAQPMVASLTSEIRTIGAAGLERYDRTLSRFTELIAGAAGSISELSPLMAGSVASLIAREVSEGRGAQLESLLPELVFTLLVPCVGPEAAVEEMRRIVEG